MARRRRNPEIIAGRVNADGSIAAGDGFTVVFASVGVYSPIRFTAPGFRLVSLIAVPLTAGYYADVTVQLEASAEIRTFLTSTSAATSAAWGFIAAGVQQ